MKILSIKKELLLFIVLGMLSGFFYWYFYSCENGCAITSSWWKTSFLGGVFGYSLGGMYMDYRGKGKE